MRRPSTFIKIKDRIEEDAQKSINQAQKSKFSRKTLKYEDCPLTEVMISGNIDNRYNALRAAAQYELSSSNDEQESRTELHANSKPSTTIPIKDREAIFKFN